MKPICTRYGALLIAVGTALAGLCVAAPTAAEEVLRASPFGPPGHLLNRQVLASWAESVARATQGRVRVEILPQSVAPAPAIKSAIQRGLADVSLMSNGALTDAPALNALVEFAGQTPDAERASVAYQRIVQRYPAMVEEFEPLVLLGVFTHGPGVLMLNQPAPDARGMEKLTVHAGGAGAATAVRALGAQVLISPGPAARDLMEQGRAAGSMTPFDSYAGFDLARYVKAAVVMPGGFYNAGLSLVVNRERWDALPAADRAAIQGVSGEVLARAAGRAWDEGDARSRQRMQAEGVAVSGVDAGLSARLLAARTQQERAWIERRGVLAADAENALAEYREELRVLPGPGPEPIAIRP